jgi:ribosomal protein L4
MAVLTAESMNSYDIFYHKNLIILKDAISKIHEIFGSKNSKDKKVVA